MHCPDSDDTRSLAGLARLLTTQHPLLDMLDDVASSYQAPVETAGRSDGLACRTSEGWLNGIV